MTDDTIKYASPDDKREAFAELGDGARAFYEGILRDNPSPRVRAAVEEVLVEAATKHRAGRRAARGGLRRAGRLARGL